MAVAFFRQFKIEVQLQKTKRPVQFAAGFSGPVGPKTGMIENLHIVDAWILKALEGLKRQSFRDESAALLQFEKNLKAHAKLNLVRVEIRDLLSTQSFVREAGVTTRIRLQSLDLGGQLCELRIQDSGQGSVTLSLVDRVRDETFTFADVPG